MLCFTNAFHPSDGTIFDRQVKSEMRIAIPAKLKDVVLGFLKA